MQQRIPPHSIEAERSLLCAVIRDASTLVRIESVISPGDFYHDGHRRVWEAMRALKAAGTPIDPVTLGKKLKDTGNLERVGGAMGINSFLDANVVIANIEHYAKEVSEKSIVRKVLSVALDIESKAYSGYGDFERFIAQSRGAMASAANYVSKSQSNLRRIDEDLKQVWRDITEETVPEGVVKTGISTVDRITGGLFPGLVTILAGRPGMGKSAFALNVGMNAAKAGEKVVLITMEDTRYFIVLRLIARYANIDLQDLTLRTINPNKYPNILDAIVRLTGLTFWVDDTSAMSPQQIHARLAAHKEEHGLSLVIIDHLMEMSSDGVADDTTRVARTAASTRDMIKDLNVSCLLLHQLNRKTEDRPNKRPNMGDLKQSGRVEEVCRAAWFLYRPAYYEGDEDDSRRDIELIVGKTNHGKLGVAKLWGKLSNMFIRGWDRETDGDFAAARKDETSDLGTPKPWTPSSAITERGDY